MTVANPPPATPKRRPGRTPRDPSGQPYSHVTLRLPPGLPEQIARACAARRCARSDGLRQAIEEWVARALRGA